MMDLSGHNEREWSDLCDKVKGLIPTRIGEEAWYLIIVEMVNPSPRCPINLWS